jgi:hypothetical protein
MGSRTWRMFPPAGMPTVPMAALITRLADRLLMH